MMLQLQQNVELAAQKNDQAEALEAIQKVVQWHCMLASTAELIQDAQTGHLRCQQQKLQHAKDMQQCQIKTQTASCIARLLSNIEEEPTTSTPAEVWLLASTQAARCGSSVSPCYILQLSKGAQRKGLQHLAAEQANQVLKLRLQLLDNEAEAGDLQLTMSQQLKDGIWMDAVRNHAQEASNMGARLVPELHNVSASATSSSPWSSSNTQFPVWLCPAGRAQG
jgi:hypothetical protein